MRSIFKTLEIANHDTVVISHRRHVDPVAFSPAGADPFLTVPITFHFCKQRQYPNPGLGLVTMFMAFPDKIRVLNQLQLLFCSWSTSFLFLVNIVDAEKLVRDEKR